MKWQKASAMVLAMAIATAGVAASQAITIQTVTVGNPGNAGELSGAGAGGYGDDAFVGAVGYSCNMGKYEVTTGQYVAFLNAVAASDTYGLYNPYMWSDPQGCRIQRSGSAGHYTYSVAATRANYPVNLVAWCDAARFCNWLQNGQPTGAQGPATTEDGSYTLSGSTWDDPAIMAVTRKPGATWVIPTESEWYKAAYHKNDGATENYWHYPTRSDSTPTNGNPEGDTGNTANYYDGDYTVASMDGTSAVGLFSLSPSPYGTFDQGGNLYEWNETLNGAGTARGLRGGDWSKGSITLIASNRISFLRDDDGTTFLGFRVAQVPEPGTLMLLLAGLLGGIAIALRRRR